MARACVRNRQSLTNLEKVQFYDSKIICAVAINCSFNGKIASCDFMIRSSPAAPWRHLCGTRQSHNSQNKGSKQSGAMPTHSTAWRESDGRNNIPERHCSSLVIPQWAKYMYFNVREERRQSSGKSLHATCCGQQKA